MATQNIVIIGGGGAGVQLATQLAAQLPKVSTQYKVVLITAREVYVHLLAALRMVVNPAEKMEESSLIPYDSLFPKDVGSVKFGSVENVQPQSTGGEVVLEGGERIPYRFLVVATGGIWGGPLSDLSGTKENLLASVRKWQTDFKNAKNIVLAGAGAVGLELAGELRDVYPDGSKRITIVHADPQVLNDTYPSSFRNTVQRKWEKRNINFVLADRLNLDNVVPDADGRIYTKENRPLQADLVVQTTGYKPNTKLLETLQPAVLDENRRVIVTPTLQVRDHPDIFAAGDIINTAEQKQLMKTEWHAATIVANIVSLIKGEKAQATYKTKMEAIFVTNGKAAGAGVIMKLWKPTFGDWMVSMMKGKHLFVPQQRKLLGQA